MASPMMLEFVVVSNDYPTATAVSRGVKKCGGKFNLSPSADAARECLGRRKIDGIFVDLEVPDTLALLADIRHGTSNAKAVVFACVRSSKEASVTLSAGANFLLLKPLSADGVAVHITIARELLERERRRYFRHPASFPITLKDADGEQNAKLTNLSEGGMAVRTTRLLNHSSMIEFDFEVSFGAAVRGRGEVAWTNKEGMAGIFIHTLHGKGREHLDAWLLAREQLAATGVSAETSP